MQKFDVIVVGSGSGLDVASYADDRGLKVALVEDGPLGGTCLNRGCIPSKMLIHSADVARLIKKSSLYGIAATIKKINFTSIVNRVSESVDNDSEQIEKGIEASENLTFFKGHARFVGTKILEVNDSQITSDKIFIAAGARPRIPKIKGIESISYLTSTEALRLTKQPKKLLIVGGGYIACELGYFYSALGTEVTIVVRGTTLLKNEDREISKWFTGEFTKNTKVLFNTKVSAFSQTNTSIMAKLSNRQELDPDQVLIATGTVPNTGALGLSATGIATDNKGFITVDEYLQTGVEGVYAFGDIVGILPLKHTANHQVGYAIRNGINNKRIPVDYTAIAHAVFSSPQVAGVGKTEEELINEKIPYKVGLSELRYTGMGDALQENGLVKVLADADGMILGCHIVGPEAATLIHEAVVAMKTFGHISAIANSVYVHPALSEWFQRAFYDIE